LRGDNPRKSRMRGSAARPGGQKIHTSRPAQRHAAADVLAFAQFEIAMLWRDLLMAGLRPVIRVKSLAASSMAPFSSEALTPMFTTIFTIFGIWWTFL
jgi:hypothetical protein